MKKKREFQSSELVKSFAKIYGFEEKLLAFEVKDFLGWDEATNTFYFESNEGSPLRTAIYKVDGKGKKTKLS